MKNLRSGKSSLKVVVTGGTRGLGRALSRGLLEKGDKVCVISRAPPHLPMDLPANLRINASAHTADIGSPEQVSRVFDEVADFLDGEMDMFLNCAALSGGYRSLSELDAYVVASVVSTNLTGTLLCCKHAFDIMSKQETGGAVFNFTGNGSNGWGSPRHPAYGATKSGVRQLTRSLREEWKDSGVSLHEVSPGLMTTDLLLDNLDEGTLAMLNPMCSSPERVAHHLVPRMRRAYFGEGSHELIAFLTPLKMVWKILSSGKKYEVCK